MLKKLTIKNIALIDSAIIEFTEGLNVLSGETGAGKSVIIESLNFVLGAKAEKSLIRSGEVECQVVAEFNVYKNAFIYELFNEFDFEQEDVLLISRKFNLDGKSSIKVNGNTVTVGMLKRIAGCLVDVHGQSEHFSLLSKANQLKLIDKFGGEECLKIKNKSKLLFEKLKEVENKIDQLGGDERSRATRLDILEYQINEIQSADLNEDEEERLIELKQKILNQEKISNSLSNVKLSIYDDGGVENILLNVLKSISSITHLSTQYESLYNRIDLCITELNDISSCADNLLYDLDLGNIDPIFVETRLELIKKLKKKYGYNIREVLDFLDNAIIERNRLENFNQLYQQLLDEKEKLSKELYTDFTTLSNIRRKHALIFADNVCVELKTLAMTSASFSVDFNDLPKYEDVKFNSANGLDEVEFTFSANKGEPKKPLSYVISGGEMSRFMVAIKAQTAKYNDISTFIFDEIDAGISGKTATVMAEKFAAISKNVQLIAITHLPQISCFADNNLLIVKTEREDRMHTTVQKLDYDGKVEEISRLIGSSNDSDSAKIHAKSMIEQANKFKSLLN